MHHGPNGQGSVEPVTSSTPTQREIKSVTITGSLEQRGARHVRHIHSAPAPNGPSATTPSPATARTVRSLKVDKISEERATPDYATPPQTMEACKR